MKKRRWILLGLLSLLFLFTCQLTPTTAEAAGYYDYEIQSYDVNITVTKENVLHITENLSVFFNTSKHGIYRRIPLKNEVTRLDGSESTVRATVKNCESNEKFSREYDSGDCVLKLGDEDITLTGQKDYVISYDYVMGNDVLDDADEFYFNLIGTGWKDTQISNVTFTITMPEEFDESKLGFSHGYSGSTDTDDIYYSITGNTITGYMDSDYTLQPTEALTVRLELPDGYFYVRKPNYALYVVSFAIPLICVILAGLMWFMVGRDETVVETVEFTPPENRNSAEVAFALKGSVDSKDIISLIVYLANKGYLTIEETESDGLFHNKPGFRLNMGRPYDGNVEEERIFLSGLFMGRTSVTKSDLEDKFYKTIQTITTKMNAKENKEFLFEKNSINKTGILVLMILVSFAAIILPPMYALVGGFDGGMLVGFIFPLVAVCMIALFAVQKMNWFARIFIVIWGLGFGGVPFITMLWPSIGQDPIFIIAFLVGILCAGGIVFFATIMSRRTAYGREILGRVRGFKNFLLLAEKDRLEALVETNPNYFYDILPYAYVFDISDKWMKKFESIALESPDWYYGPHGNTMFNMMAFNSFMNSTMSSATSSMTSSPSSSGGGSSGGGSGGGGGGSW